jgi:chemotaxis protein methyltransferase CheR
MTGCLSEVIALVREQTGLVLPAHREAALLAALRRAAPDLDPCDIVRAAAGPGWRDLLDRLTDELTIQESSFLRDEGQLALIDWHAMRAVGDAAGYSQIRVWSSGCAQGEEAYSLALLAADAFAPDPAPVSVLGTDISRRAIGAARAGRYGSRALRALNARQLGRYFEPQPDGGCVVGGPLRRMVRFARHNLAMDTFPPPGEPAFDVIVCRNVLIYFGAGLAGRVIQALENSLRPGGVLVLGAADALLSAPAPPALAVAQPVPAAAPSGPEQPPRPKRSSRPGTLRQRAPGQRARDQQDGSPGKDGLRRPLGLADSRSRQDRLSAALDAADRGHRDRADAALAEILAEDPMDAEAQFVHGLVALEAGDPRGAAAALRRALYADSSFALAAFTLGRAYDALGDAAAARRSYRQALHYLDPDDQRADLMLKHVDIADIAAACRARLAGG